MATTEERNGHPARSDKRVETMEKDAIELELEELLFGDDVAFHERIREDAAAATSNRFQRRSADEAAPDELSASDLSDASGKDVEQLDDSDLFFIDAAPLSATEGHLVPVKQDTEQVDELLQAEAPVWEDSDDDRLVVSLASNPRLRKLRLTEAEDTITGKEYTKRLRRQFERLYPVPEWALPSSKTGSSKMKRRPRPDRRGASESDSAASDDDMDIDEDLSAVPLAKLLQTNDSLTLTGTGEDGPRRRLRPEVLDIQRCKDVGETQPAAVTSLSFHPAHPFLLSSGPSSTMFLHHVTTSTHTLTSLLTSLHVRSTPLTTAAFDSPLGTRILFSGRRHYFYIWDLPSGQIEKVTRIYGHAGEQRSMERFKPSPCGRWLALVGSGRKGGGTINILNATTTQWVAQVRVEGRGGIADFAWWTDGEGLAAIGKGGEAIEWRLNDRQDEDAVVNRWQDDGAMGTTVLALGGSSADALGGARWVAVGSQSGIVNIYDRKSWRVALQQDHLPKPFKVFEHLTTSINNIVFSPDGQLMVFTSKGKRDALRLIHLPSCTVYRNWPTSSTPLGRITAVAFSADSSMLAVANEQGKIRLWEIRS
ncbi:MAG: hypothetical protein M1825_004876 [Sarcosagium campestre]|nr:MAG: hypothetical protein M1825_004876 [Sarcosagium campestre]